jgi:hypothetical protein
MRIHFEDHINNVMAKHMVIRYMSIRLLLIKIYNHHKPISQVDHTMHPKTHLSTTTEPLNLLFNLLIKHTIYIYSVRHSDSGLTPALLVSLIVGHYY